MPLNCAVGNQFVEMRAEVQVLPKREYGHADAGVRAG